VEAGSRGTGTRLIAATASKRRPAALSAFVDIAVSPGRCYRAPTCIEELRMLRSAVVPAAILFSTLTLGGASSPYSGEESREIKALSPQEIADYEAGKGMGLAKAAELNGYPGPAHVLELADDLQLTAEQRAATRAIIDRMRMRAVALGKDLVDEERVLDQKFASHAIDADSLQRALERIGRLQGELRRSHLEAHLAEASVLTPHQIMRYNVLRGYSTGGEHSMHDHHGG
jgi:Spy/CpxP family protein refolding chaperone